MHRVSTAQVIENMWSNPVAMAESQLTPENLIAFWGRKKFNKIYPHLQGKRLRQATKAKEAKEGDCIARTESDERTNPGMNLDSLMMPEQEAAQGAVEAEATNAVKVMKDMKGAAPKATKAPKAMKAEAPKTLKAMKHTNSMATIQVND